MQHRILNEFNAHMENHGHDSAKIWSEILYFNKTLSPLHDQDGCRNTYTSRKSPMRLNSWKIQEVPSHDNSNKLCNKANRKLDLGMGKIAGQNE